MRFLSLGGLDFNEIPLSTQYVTVRTGPGENDFGNVYLSDFRTWMTELVNLRIDNLGGETGGGTGPSIWPIPRTVSLTGPVTGSATFDGSADFALATAIADNALSIAKISGLQGSLNSKLDSNSNAVSASKLLTPRAISVSGIVTGTTTFDGSSDVSITTSMADNALSLSKVSGLSNALSNKADLSGATFTGHVSLRSGVDFWAPDTQSGVDLRFNDETGLLFSSITHDRTTGSLGLYRYTPAGTISSRLVMDDTTLKFNQNLVYHAGNLDVGTFAYLSAPVTEYVSTANINCDNFTAGSKAIVHSANLNTPGASSSFWYIETISTGTGTNNLLQRAWSSTIDESYFRRCASGAWGSWRRNWNNSNFDPSSKLDSNGNAASATKLNTPRSFSLTGAVTSASFTFDGTQNVAIDAAIPDGSVSLAKIANVTTGQLLGRSSAGSGVIEGIQIGSGLVLSGGILSATGSVGGSLVNWTEGLSNTTPNASTPVVYFAPNNAAANVDVAITVKGAAALMATVPDNDIAGGNKRGARSVDWQLVRSAPDRVASGAWAVIGGGSSNAASGSYSSVGGGENNTASGIGAAVVGGRNNSAAGLQAFVGSGQTCNASGSYSGVVCGENVSATGTSAVVINGRESTASGDYSTTMAMRANTRNIQCSVARGIAFSPSNGAAQAMQFQLGASTTSATVTAATADFGAADTTNQVVLPNNSVYTVRGMVTARQGTTGDVAGWHIEALVKRGAGASTTTIVSSTVTSIGNTSGASAWTVQLVPDLTNGALRVNVTGETSKSINWVVDVYSSAQVVF